MSMLVLQPSTSTIIFGETGGRVAVAVGGVTSVNAVAVSVRVTGSSVPVGVSVMNGGLVVFVIVTITGVIVKMDGVMVGGGAGKVGIEYDQPLQAVSDKVRKNAIKLRFFIYAPL
jgi:hypothetical protein